MGLGRRGKGQEEKEIVKSGLGCWSAQNRESWGELPGIQTSGWAGCTLSESQCGAESQQKLLGEHDLSHMPRQSSFSASMSYVAVYALYAKVTQTNELNGVIHSNNIINGVY